MRASDAYVLDLFIGLVIAVATLVICLAGWMLVSASRPKLTRRQSSARAAARRRRDDESAGVSIASGAACHEIDGDPAPLAYPELAAVARRMARRQSASGPSAPALPLTLAAVSDLFMAALPVTPVASAPPAAPARLARASPSCRGRVDKMSASNRGGAVHARARRIIDAPGC